MQNYEKNTNTLSIKWHANSEFFFFDSKMNKNNFIQFSTGNLQKLNIKVRQASKQPHKKLK